MYEIMKKQGHEEETGKTKITSGYNLPATYILHTVGPIIQWEVTGKEEELLASCYRECLKLAADTGAESVASVNGGVSFSTAKGGRNRYRDGKELYQ